MLEKVHYYIAHPQEREAIGRAGKLEVATNHTWEVRVQTLFEMLAGLEY
jgi:spore maturation protein CgeB